MKVFLTERARERGFIQVSILRHDEEEDYIACVLYEKRNKKGEVVEEVSPAIIFKKDIKHGDYELSVRLAEESGLCMIFPDDKNFRTDYYGLEFMGHKTIVKSWGYVSNHLPGYRRWKWNEIHKAATTWLEDMKNTAEIIRYNLSVIQYVHDYESQLKEIKEYLLTNKDIRPFLVA